MDFFDDFYELIAGGISIVIVTGIILAVIFGVAKYDSANDEKAWNDGYCSCGGQWEYQQAVGHRYDTDYIYKCDKCGKIEEFNKARKTSTSNTSTHDEECYKKCPSCGYYDKGINYCPKCGTRMVK